MIEKDCKPEAETPRIEKNDSQKVVEGVRSSAGIVLGGGLEIGNLPKLKEFSDLYNGRISPSNFVRGGPTEKLNFSLGSNELQSKVNSILRNALGKYEEAKRDPKKPFTPERNGDDKTLIPLLSEVVDPSVPIMLKADKRIYLSKGGEMEEMVFMDLVVNGRIVAELNFKVRGRGIEIYHRYTYPKYQGQGVGNLLLRGAEDFGRARGELTKKPIISEAETGQVDVMLWLYKNGYRPDSIEDVEKMRMIVAGDPSLAIADEWSVHKRDNLDNRKEHNIPRNSFRLKMKKRIE